MRNKTTTIQQAVFKTVDCKVTNESFNPLEARTDSAFDEVIRAEVEYQLGGSVKLTTVCRYVELYKSRYKKYNNFVRK